MMPIRVLLADDHALVRAGIRSLLQAMHDIDVVGEADDGRSALRLIAETQPDVVLMDIAMPGLNGLEATTRITADFPSARVIILSMHMNEDYVLQAIRAGASGYLLKGARATELELAVLAAARGEMYLSPAASKHVVGHYINRPGGADQSDQAFHVGDRLTPRQREILQLIAEGRTTKEIAHLLNISAKTVEMHRTQLMKRLDIHDIAGLVRYAIRNGIITED